MNENIEPDSNSANDSGDAVTVDTSLWDSGWPFDEKYNFAPPASGSNVTLDWETSDRITVCTLKHHLDIIHEKEHNHKVFGEWYHEDDKEYDRKLKKAIYRVLKYFGEDAL